MKKLLVYIAFFLCIPLLSIAQNKQIRKSVDNKIVSSKNKLYSSEQDSTSQKQNLKITKIAPNPASDWVKITYESSDEVAVSIEVYDIKGNLLIPNSVEYQNKDKVIFLKDITNFPVGHYEFRIKAGSESATGAFKVIK